MEKIRISVCITVLNEEKTIEPLLRSLSNQTFKPYEIVIVDAGSKDKTIGIIKRFKKVKIIVSPKVSRSKGRNIAIQMAKGNVIALTDAGCIPNENWLSELTKPFLKKSVDVVAGFYTMKYKNNLQKSMQFFLGTTPSKLNSNFMPSARSMAFTKTVWKNADGFPENMHDTAEDTLFNTRLLKIGANIHVAPDSIVEWSMPDTLKEFFTKIYKYAKGDAKSGIWWHPVKKFNTHNIKILTIFARYLLLIFIFLNNIYAFLILFSIYLFYSYLKAGLWGIILQIVSDLAVIIGFTHGLL